MDFSLLEEKNQEEIPKLSANNNDRINMRHTKIDKGSDLFEEMSRTQGVSVENRELDRLKKAIFELKINKNSKLLPFQ